MNLIAGYSHELTHLNHIIHVVIIILISSEIRFFFSPTRCAPTHFDYQRLSKLFYPSLEKRSEQSKEVIGGDLPFHTSLSVWFPHSTPPPPPCFLYNPSIFFFSTSPQSSPAFPPASSHPSRSDVFFMGLSED